tara:strand:+ start:191 stop:523 length:333 start_codon:yes stop_codon:yes gene_type:complete
MVSMTLFTGEQSMAGYRLNKLSASLIDPANRTEFLADELAYCRRFELTTEETRLVTDRNWAGMVAAGGNVYVFLKIAATVGSNLLEVGAEMRGETIDQFMANRQSSKPHG